MSLKTENSRRVAKSRPVCMGLKTELNSSNDGNPSLTEFLLWREFLDEFLSL
jgi:hypothetical protein